MSDLDPRWEWVEIRTLGDPAPMFVKGQCNHLDVVPVRAGDILTNGLGEQGALVGHLCLTCDTQLPAEWRP